MIYATFQATDSYGHFLSPAVTDLRVYSDYAFKELSKIDGFNTHFKY